MCCRFVAILGATRIPAEPQQWMVLTQFTLTFKMKSMHLKYVGWLDSVKSYRFIQ